MDRFGDEIMPAIRSNLLCERIIVFLLNHEGAMDTLQGIANCWVQSDEVAVRSALDSLVSAGVVATHAFGSRLYYNLTPNRAIRGWLAANRSTLSQKPEPVPGVVPD